MKITIVADSQRRHFLFQDELPGGDILILAGNLTSRGYNGEMLDILTWLSKVDYKHKILVPGKTDTYFQEIRKQTLDIDPLPLSEGTICIDDSIAEVEGLKFYGSPWQRSFEHWPYYVTEEDAASKWALIPEGLDFLISAQAPYDIMDLNFEGNHIGCPELLKRVKQVKPKYHVYGCLAGAFPGTFEQDGITFINANLLDRSNNLMGKPFTIEV